MDRQMGALRILHLSDARPGHYHLAEGVIAAIGRLVETRIHMLTIRRRRLVPGRLLRSLIDGERMSPQAVLRLGYGVASDQLGEAALVVSAGGETLAANAAAAKLLGAANIFVGSLRGMNPEQFSLAVTSYQAHADLPRHLVTLKPCAIDPDVLARSGGPAGAGMAGRPTLAGLLIGGNSGLFTYQDQEWRSLFDFARDVSRECGTRWLVSTSRRTAPHIAEAAFDLAKDKSVVADFVDYRLAGPGTLVKIFTRADAIVCTEDSSTMISEAVWARLPVVGVAPAHHSFKPEEAQYREMMRANDWCRFLPISGLSVASFAQALGEIRPLTENPLDRLAEQIKARLPALFLPSR